MSAISAQDVKALRDRTGAGFMDCRTALSESDGDFERAVEILRARIVKGKLDKWLDEVVLLRQKHVNEEKYAGKTIEEIRTELASETRENVVIRRFARFAVGG